VPLQKLSISSVYKTAPFPPIIRGGEGNNTTI